MVEPEKLILLAEYRSLQGISQSL